MVGRKCTDAAPRAPGAEAEVCFRCGRTSHESSSEISSPIETSHKWRSQSAAAAAAAAEAAPQGASSAASPATAAAAQETHRKAKKVPKKVPNLTPERLLSDDGLGYILRYFPKSFKFRGRGHEVGDLGNLIGLYREWHSQLLPSYPFDQFVQKVEKVGAKNRVRMCIRDLRERVANGGDPSKLHEPPVERDGEHYEPVEEGNNLDVPSFDNGKAPEWTNEADVVMQEEELADEIYNTVTGEPSQSPLIERTANERSSDHSSLNETPNQVADNSTNSLSENQISEEQKARIEASRLKALERAAARVRMSQAA
ncbi:hypothetical protein Syun_022418 [Stephania yunnanensis]|uniref:Chromosome segregation in meiosis protein 3 domain-containing protein n=1 Tax=Stephania yunnanensis TaxID=152371 RepID=A0AAP0I1I3_9MAGN